MSKSKEQKYWICIIGSVEESKLKNGADAPLRNAVENAYGEMLGDEDTVCWSGWGSGQEKVDTLNAVWSMEKDDPLYISIQAMLRCNALEERISIMGQGKVYSGKEVSEMMKASYKAGYKEIKCNCDNEIKTGQTSVMCCNICGKPDEKFWSNK
jgi:hypothetical protein